MGMSKDLGRRQFLARAASGIAALSLGGCDKLSTTPWFANLLGTAAARLYSRPLKAAH
jgi:hypothetical protein